jgi:hypothetical protein
VGVAELTREKMNVKALGEEIQRILGVLPNETLEIKIDRLNRNRLLIIRHPKVELSEAGPSLID